MAEIDAKALVKNLVAWLRKRGEPDSGIHYSGRYSGRWYDEVMGAWPAEVRLFGTDADFVRDNFHDKGARDLAEALSALTTEPQTEAGERYRHKKGGTEYVLIGYGKMQSGKWLTEATIISRDAGGVIQRSYANNSEVAIYRSVTDPTEIWVRPREEFEDGRFEKIGAAP